MSSEQTACGVVPEASQSLRNEMTTPNTQFKEAVNTTGTDKGHNIFYKKNLLKCRKMSAALPFS